MCFDARVCAAASRGSNDAVRRLVLAGAELNSRTTDERQWTAYHFAVFGNFPETVKMLHGESVRARAKVSVVSSCLTNRFAELGADVNAKGARDFTPLHQVLNHIVVFWLF